MTLLALGGGELKGDKLVQLVFLDESGIGNMEHEPITVVAGIIVNADEDVLKIQNHLMGMVEKYVPVEHRPGFRFHAKELISGGKVFAKSEHEKRMAILEELCSLPKLFDIPVFAGSTNRKLAESMSAGKSQKKIIAHTIAATAFQCILQVEGFMRSRPDAKELACLFFEKNDTSDTIVRGMLRSMSKEISPEMKLGLEHLLPIERIMREISFQEKGDSSLLQIADACAWAIRRHLTLGSAAERFFAPIAPQLLESSKFCMSLGDPAGVHGVQWRGD